MAKIVFDDNKITLSDMMEIEKGRTFAQTAKFLQKFVVSDSGDAVDDKAAKEHVVSLNIAQVRAQMSAFWKHMSGVKADAVNPQTPTA